MYFLSLKKKSVLVLATLASIAQCLTYNSTALMIGVDENTIGQASYMLNGYGIGFETLPVPVTGAPLPNLETAAGGNYGLLVVVAQVQYNGTSALTDDQWNTLYAYQEKYGVRMIQLEGYPDPNFGVELIAACCGDSMEQNVTLISDMQASQFPTAGLNSVPMGTVGLYHYATSILEANASTTTAFLNFEANAVIQNTSVGGVINDFANGRQQMVFFLEFGNWSETSAYMHHMWVQWGYRGAYQGYRRVYLQTQVDDLFLQTALYSTNTIFRLRSVDLYNHVQWTYDINRRLNKGSSYFSEFGFNANGNIIYNYAASLKNTQLTCGTPVVTDWDEPTQLEFIKPLGSGDNKWPTTPSFVWTADCIFLDPLTQFFANTTQRDAFGLVSHTFTHLELNNATYHDGLREIQYNLMYGEILNFTNAAKFSGSGLIPPAITGLHNGDVIRAWADNGLWNAIGDNTRPELRNPENHHWPLMTTMALNGYDGYQITPRFATRIYYNCDLVPCDVQQWIDTEDGVTGEDVIALLAIERRTVGAQLLSLYHDPYMFHQPNLRNDDVTPVLINGKMQKLSLLQMWVEVITDEMMKLVTWPLITLKHDHIAMGFNQRMLLDKCKPYIQYTTSAGSNSTQQITGVTVRAGTNDTCEMPVPVTIPTKLSDSKGYRIEQIGTDPATIWVKMDGAPVTLAFESPIVL